MSLDKQIRTALGAHPGRRPAPSFDTSAQKPIHSRPSDGPTPAEVRLSIATSNRLFSDVLDRPCEKHSAPSGESCFPPSTKTSRNACGRRLSTLSRKD